MDVNLSDATRIGGALAFSPGRTRLGGDSSRTRSVHPAIYGRHDTETWSLGLGAGYGRHDIQTTRGIVIGPISRRASADYRADQYSGQLSGAVTLVKTTPVSLQAIGELRYSRLTREAFGESGADSVSLTDVSEARSESLRSVLGVRTSWRARLGALALRPELKLGWARESLDHQGELTAALTGATSLPTFQRFTVRGVNEGRDSAVISVGATTAFVKRGRAFLLYDGIFNGGRAEHGFGVGAQIHW
jgi:outer membrane autotransporter protein